MIKPYIILICLSVFINSLFADVVTDSLLFELKNTDQNKEKSILLNKLSKSFIESNIDSAVFYSNKGLLIAKEINYSLGIAENAASLGDYYIIKDNLIAAKRYYTLANSEFEFLEMHFDNAQILMVIGNIYLSQDNYSEALMYYQKSQLISEEYEYSEVLSHIYNNTGIINLSLYDHEKALNNFKKAFKFFQKENLKENMALTLSNIGLIYHKKSMDSLANEYYDEALILFKEENNFIGASNVYSDLGNHEMNKGNYQQSLEYFNKAYSLAIQVNPEYKGPRSKALVGILGSLGKNYFYLGNRAKAIENLEKSLELAIQNHYVAWIESNSYELSKLYEEEGNTDKALEYYKSYERFGDSLLNENSIKRITQLEMQFEFDKTMKDIELEAARKETAQQRKEFIYLLIISLGIFIAIIAILMFFNQRNKTIKIELKRQNLRLEHDKLQQELEHKNKELATNVMYLLSKNEFITSTAEKLSDAKLNFKKENQKVIQDVIRDLLMNSSKDVWKEFEVRFQEVHSDFYNNLNEKYPDLTPNEKKICAFLRLNMSTKDISAITYQSLRSINMARFRLRKKMELETDENLVSILSQL